MAMSDEQVLAGRHLQPVAQLVGEHRLDEHGVLGGVLDQQDAEHVARQAQWRLDADAWLGLRTKELAVFCGARAECRRAARFVPSRATITAAPVRNKPNMRLCA